MSSVCELAIEPRREEPPSSYMEPLCYYGGRASLFGGVLQKIRHIAHHFLDMIALDWRALSATLKAAFNSAEATKNSSFSSDLMNWIDVTTNLNQITLGWKWIKSSPAFLSLRILCLAKQTSDLALTFWAWLQGRQKNQHLVHQSVNTCLAWSPFILQAIKFARTHPIGQLVGGIMLSFYAFSVFDDAQHYSNQKKRISPTLELLEHSFKTLRAKIA